MEKSLSTVGEVSFKKEGENKKERKRREKTTA